MFSDLPHLSACFPAPARLRCTDTHRPKARQEYASARALCTLIEHAPKHCALGCPSASAWTCSSTRRHAACSPLSRCRNLGRKTFRTHQVTDRNPAPREIAARDERRDRPALVLRVCCLSQASKSHRHGRLHGCRCMKSGAVYPNAGDCNRSDRCVRTRIRRSRVGFPPAASRRETTTAEFTGIFEVGWAALRSK